MGGYPPGTSAGDPNAPWNAPDMSHDHQWRLEPQADPRLEDCAAKFHVSCAWRKVQATERGYRGEIIVTEAIPCEETRTISLEPIEVEPPDSGSSISVPEDQEDWTDRIWTAIETVQDGDQPTELVCVEPPQIGGGRVVAECNGVRVVYAGDANELDLEVVR